MRSYNVCSHSGVKRHELTKMFVIAHCDMEKTEERSCKYDQGGLFEHLLFSFTVCVTTVNVLVYNFLSFTDIDLILGHRMQL